jgi:hypothetical protein
MPMRKNRNGILAVFSNGTSIWTPLPVGLALDVSEWLTEKGLVRVDEYREGRFVRSYRRSN